VKGGQKHSISMVFLMIL